MKLTNFHFSGTCKFKTTSKVSTFKGIKIISDSIQTCEDQLKKNVASSVAFKETLLKKQGCKKDEPQSEESSEKWVDAKTGAVCELEIKASCEEKTARRKRSSRSANSEYSGQLNVTSKKSVAVVEQPANSGGDAGDSTGTGSGGNTGGNTGSNTGGNTGGNTDNNTVGNTDSNTGGNTPTEEQEEKLEDFTATDIVQALNAAVTEKAEEQSKDNSADKPFELVVEENDIEVKNEDVKETTEEVDTENVETVKTAIPEKEDKAEEKPAEKETPAPVPEKDESKEKIEALEKLVQELKTENDNLETQIKLLDENYEKLEGEIDAVSSKQRKTQLLSIMQQSQSSMEIFNMKKQIEEMASQFYNGMAQTLTMFSPTKNA